MLLESVFPEGFSRSLTAGTWAVFVAVASMWAERHAVYPAGATRLLYLAIEGGAPVGDDLSPLAPSLHRAPG